jgi:transcriptional regulator with XRE-family HTH domain
MSFRSLVLTGEQIRAARALARVEQAELAKLCALSLETIKRLERIRGPVDANIRTLNAIVTAFEEMGIRFDGCADGGTGVCRPPHQKGTSWPPLARRGLAREAVEPLQRLIYFSTLAPQAVAALKSMLDEISEVAIRLNPERGVTGVLMACNGRFLQVLEGPKVAVQQVYGAVSSDPRHYGLQVLENRAVTSRQFPDWKLCCGVFLSDDQLFRHEPAMADGFHPELLTPASAFGLLSIVRDLECSSPRNYRGGRGGCLLAAECLDQVCTARVPQQVMEGGMHA